MNKAFIFDMDGVLVDSERAWEGKEHKLLANIFGDNFARNLDNTLIGTSIRDTYEQASAKGTSVSYEMFKERYDEMAQKVLASAKITDGLNAIGQYLIKMNYKLGLVSSSPRNWIDLVLPRVPFHNNIEVIISLTDFVHLRRKPKPDGYLEALKQLDAEASMSIILEDSNPGIQSAKASGCYVIGFRGNLVTSYKQTGADVYADTMGEVMRLVEEFTRQ